MTTISNYPSPNVLVAIMNNQRDLGIARTQYWYRIPVNNANRFIPDLEQMQYLHSIKLNRIFKGCFCRELLRGDA